MVYRLGVAVGARVGISVGARVTGAGVISAGVAVGRAAGGGVTAGAASTAPETMTIMYTSRVLIKSIVLHSFGAGRAGRIAACLFYRFKAEFYSTTKL